jgi:hypothetical protein
MNLPQKGAVSAKKSDLLNSEGSFAKEGVQRVIRGLPLEDFRQPWGDRRVEVLSQEGLSLVGTNRELEEVRCAVRSRALI